MQVHNEAGRGDDKWCDPADPREPRPDRILVQTPALRVSAVFVDAHIVVGIVETCLRVEGQGVRFRTLYFDSPKSVLILFKGVDTFDRPFTLRVRCLWGDKEGCLLFALFIFIFLCVPHSTTQTAPAL